MRPSSAEPWRPGNSALPSVSRWGKFNEEVDCDLMFYREHAIFQILEIAGEAMNAITGAYTYSWRSARGPAQVLYSDGEGALNDVQAKNALASSEASNKPPPSLLRAP